MNNRRHFLELATHECAVAQRYGQPLSFLLLLPESTAEQAFTVAERLRETVFAEPIQAPSGEAFLTISTGIAEFGSAGDALEQLICRADQALYAAKARGRNCTVLESSLDASGRELAPGRS